LIDPNPNTGFVRKQVIAIKEKAGEGVPKVVAELLENVKNT
jgi:NAD-dependent deacetylase